MTFVDDFFFVSYNSGSQALTESIRVYSYFSSKRVYWLYISICFCNKPSDWTDLGINMVSKGQILFYCLGDEIKVNIV